MSTRSRSADAVPASADPWWGGEEATAATGAFGAPVASGRPKPAATRPRRRRSPFARLFALPLTLLGDAMQRSPTVRRLVRRFVVIVALGCVTAGAVGVILVNNIVISRSAELGTLDQERRDFQRENAVLNAQTAKLSAPQLVMIKARRTLGMVESPQLPSYIYLQPCSHELTAAQRAVAARATGAGPVSCAPRRITKAAAPTAGGTPDTSTKEP
ncbi:MAG: hypothetical protein JWN72_2332 [Thermoleophilia bacterium]|nr:hypothetical protein [Thermoleophilia bacterium]